MSPLTSWLVLLGVLFASFVFAILVGTLIDRMGGDDD